MEQMRIFWQSSVKIDEYPEYREAIELHAKRVLYPGTEIEVHGVDYGTSELHFHYFSFLNTHQILENVLKAQKEGFDAVAIGCGMDPGLDEAKEISDIPVLGLSETAMFVACMLAKRFSVITHQTLLNRKRIDSLIAKYGLESRSTPSGDFSVDLETLARSFNDPKPILDAFTKAVRKSVMQGAEIVIPGCNILNLVAVQNQFYEVDGVPILDVAGNLMKMTEAMVVLNRVCGIRISRKGYFEAPAKELISKVRKIYAVE